MPQQTKYLTELQDGCGRHRDTFSYRLEFEGNVKYKIRFCPDCVKLKMRKCNSCGDEFQPTCSVGFRCLPCERSVRRLDRYRVGE